MSKHFHLRHGREHWSVDAGARDVATLDIPADAHRERVFEIDCRFVVRALGDGRSATHALRVLVDGAQEWARRADTANPGATDSLEYRFRRRVPSGQPLRLVATTEVQGAQRLVLLLEAQEE